MIKIEIWLQLNSGHLPALFGSAQSSPDDVNSFARRYGSPAGHRTTLNEDLTRRIWRRASDGTHLADTSSDRKVLERGLLPKLRISIVQPASMNCELPFGHSGLQASRAALSRLSFICFTSSLFHPLK